LKESGGNNDTGRPDECRPDDSEGPGEGASGGRKDEVADPLGTIASPADEAWG
jgi:hypothetical protein